jgi:VWFA-related protein
VNAFVTLLFCSLALLIAPSLQGVRERVSVEVVTVSVAARDRAGAPVSDLRPAELSLRIDGKPVEVETFQSPAAAAAPPASKGEASEERGERVPPRLETPRPGPEVGYLAILVDESSTFPLDRRDFYRQLERFLPSRIGSTYRVMVARFDGTVLRVECAWTSDLSEALGAVRRLDRHPNSPRVPSPAELPFVGMKRSIELDIEEDQRRLFAALLEALTAFPAEGDARTLLLASGGAPLISPPDLSWILYSPSAVADSSGRRTGPAGRQDPRNEELQRELAEKERNNFEMWNRAGRSGWYEAFGDVIAKAQAKGIALVPLAAEAPDRLTNPAADAKWASRPLPGAAEGSSGLAPRLSVVQSMTEMAKETGGEPLLVPRAAAERLRAIESGAGRYVISFRDPFAGDHRPHRLELACDRPGLKLDYRRAYRVATEEEEILDEVVAHLTQPDNLANPLEGKIELSVVSKEEARDLVRVSCRYAPPPEAGGRPEAERETEIIALGMDGQQNRTAPVRWRGKTRPVEASSLIEAAFTMRLPPGPYTWSLAVRDLDTGLTSYFRIAAKL